MTPQQLPQIKVVARSALLIAAAALLATKPAFVLADTSTADVPPQSQRAHADTILLPSGRALHPGVGTLVEDLSIGGSETIAEYRFTNITYLATGRDGSIFLVDWTALPGPVFVRQYDRNGKYVRTFGRQGQGPGEYFLSVHSVSELGDGRVILADTRYINVFTAGGEYSTRWIFGPGAIRGDPVVVGLGGIVYVPSRQAATSSPIAPQNIRAGRSTMVRMSTDGTIIDTVVKPEWNSSGPTLPFFPRMTSVWSPLGYFVTANTGSYAIDLRIPRASAGVVPPRWSEVDPVHSIRRSTPPVLLQRAERADYRTATELGQRASNPGWTWNGLDVPAVKPPIVNLVVADDGRIWVQLSQPSQLNASVAATTTLSNGTRRGAAASRWPQPVVYDLLEPDGRYVGRLPIPQGVRIHTMRGDTVWGIVRDANDVPLVKRYRIRWGG
jgi:hypothetical protein